MTPDEQTEVRERQAWQLAYQNVHAEHERLLAEVRRLQQALHTYGNHLVVCPCWDFRHARCTCGYATALAAGGTEEQP